MRRIVKLELGVVLGLALVLTGCQYNGRPQATSLTSGPAPEGSWEIGTGFQYSQEPIWGDTLVGLEFSPVASEQHIVVYDLNKRTKVRTIDLPEGRMINPPSIYGNKIVFDAADREEYIRIMASSKLEAPPNSDIFLYDLDTNRMRQLTDEQHGQMSPRIYGDVVVWLDARNQQLDRYPPSLDVYALDLKTNKETRITANTTAEGYTQLSISGSTIVWADMRHADATVTNHGSNDFRYNNEIYAYDLATGREQRLTDSPGNDWGPDIDGNRVVWIRQADYQKADVFTRDLKTGEETQVSHSGYADSVVSIDGDRVVWTDASSSQGNTSNDVIMNGIQPGSAIVMTDLLTGKETQLTPAEAGKVWLWPVSQGGHIVFEWNRQIGGVAYAMDLP